MSMIFTWPINIFCSLDGLLAGYGTDVDRDLIRGCQSWRCLIAVRWLVENGYGSAEEYPEVAVLRSR